MKEVGNDLLSWLEPLTLESCNQLNAYLFLNLGPSFNS